MSLSLIGRSADTRVRARRLVTSDVFSVETRTIGAPMVYKLTTANMSRTGLLLEQGSSRVPFLLNTLIEMTIDPRGAALPEAVQCIGKVVRLAGASDGQKQRYGVQIVQMEGKDLERWEQVIASMEKIEMDCDEEAAKAALGA